jgi:putative PEP-CTERM system histidine kinase
MDSEDDAYHHSASFEFRRDWRNFSNTDPLISLLQTRDWIIDLTEKNPALNDSLLLSLEEVGARFVVPLIFEKKLEGFIVLGSLINKNEILTYEDFDLMRMLARQSISSLQGVRLSEQLIIARELAAIGKVSTFVLHDLKNQVSGLSLMMDNAVEYADDPEFQQDMLETVGNTVSNIKGLIARLKNLKEKPELVVAPVELSKVIQDAVETAGGKVEVQGTSVKAVGDNEEIYKVVLNLLVNAAEATCGKGQVRVSFGKKDDSAYIRVSDSGCGMSAEFIKNRLFQPFETTKKHGFGIGLYQCRQIVESHNGSIKVESKEGAGTTFTVLLPLASELI